jgi:hypothetical protein
MDFTNFKKDNDTYSGNVNKPSVPFLPPGGYEIAPTQQGELLFTKTDINYDNLIDLPSPEYDYVQKRVDSFLSPETQTAFEDYGFLYKWSCMLHGSHGGGKTCIVNRVTEKVIAKGGTVLFNPNPDWLPYAFKVLEDIQPGRMVMVIFEEFDALLRRHEDKLLSILDGEIQKRNVVYLATTNNFDKIPDRLKRPGRFASILEVKYPGTEARIAYLTNKLKASDHSEIPKWVRATEGFSIDELSETVKSVKCFKNTLEETVQRIKVIRDPNLGEVINTGTDSEEAAVLYEIRKQWENQMASAEAVFPVPAGVVAR